MGVFAWFNEYILTLPSEWPEYMTGYTLLHDTTLTALPHGIDSKFDAFSIYHIFICLSYEPDTHFYFDDDHDTLFTLYPCPIKLCNYLPEDVENICTLLFVEPANSFYPL